MDRRSFLKTGVGGVATAAVLSGTTWRTALAATVGPGPYGELGVPDANGISLPAGFTSRVLAVSGSPVVGTDYVWHGAPDGGAAIAAGSGWFYVSNSELSAGAGGASVIAFASDGQVKSAARILSGTHRNCSGGATPWKTWLSCEETPTGRVWETFPKGGAAVERPAMGRFAHEAAAVDPGRGVVYLTEDVTDGGFYRFRPTAYPDLSAGVLEIATGGSGTTPVVWKPVTDPSATTTATRYQVADARRFNGGEGCYYSDRDDVCYFTTKGDNRVWRYRCDSGLVDVYYSPASVTNGTSPLTGVDNVTVARTRDVYVAEDGGSMEICLITPGRVVAPFLRVDGHAGSELTGVAFSPSGTRLYFSSQRGTDGRGITYEVRGRFR